MVAYDEGRAILDVSFSIEFCAKTYCGGTNTEDAVYTEAVDFVLKNFGHIAIDEIRAAFQLAASGKLDDVKMETYYGVFTLAMLGGILRAYDKYRNRIIAQMQNEERERKYQEREIELKSVDWVSDRLRRLDAIEAPELSDFALSDFDLFVKSGHMTYTDEQKKAAWMDAKELAFDDLEQDAAFWSAGKKNMTLASKIKEALNDARAGLENEKFKTARESFAKRLLVMRWHLGFKTEAK